MRLVLAVVPLLWLPACTDAPAHRAANHHETPVMRVLYRDGHDSMLLTFPRDGHAMPADECHAALLIDGQSGAARQISPTEAAARTRTMQLSGATPGMCPA
ncbi:UNVERIFIED_ORG: hypothetical protein M2348_003206 [Sphingomonas sp. R1F5B]